jgi:hypothetical protein
MKIRNIILAVGTVIAASAASAPAALTTFTETFNTNASNWLNATGGILDSGYISFTSTFTSGSSGPFGAPPLQTLFRGNNAVDASGDAFVGNWLASGATVVSLTLSIRHDYTSTLNLYTRLDAGSGAAASLAFSASYAIAPNTWTTITIPIQNSNPPFLSYGAGDYNSVFTNIQNLQIGMYVPASTTFTNLNVGIDNVSITVVPEPHEYALGMVGLMAVVILARRRRQAAIMAV